MLGLFKSPFKRAAVEELKAPLKNPGRGFYQIHTFDISQDVDIDGLRWSIDKNDTLALVFVELGVFLNVSIPPEVLDNLSRILDFFGENEMEVIFRAAYDTVGNAFSSEPSSFGLVQEHYRDILEVLMRHRDTVLICQGCLIGHWGEMHGSRFLNRDNLRELYRTYMEVTGGAIPLAVRQAVHWRIIHSPDRYCGNMACTGIFDDAILAYPDHLGSFGQKPGSDAGWMEKWKMDEELTFISGISRVIPFGGEAVCNDNNLPTAEEAVERLRALGTSYLNKIHHPAMIIDWKSRILPDNGIFAGWGGSTLYDYIDAHLGYRLVIESLKISKPNAFGEPKGIILDIKINNTGFALLYDSAVLELNRLDGETSSTGTDPKHNHIDGNAPSSGTDHGSNRIDENTPSTGTYPEYKHIGGDALSPGGDFKTGEIEPLSHKKEFPTILPGESASFRFEVSPERGDYYLNLRRDKDGAVIKFANSQKKQPADPSHLSYFEKIHYPGTYLGTF